MRGSTYSINEEWFTCVDNSTTIARTITTSAINIMELMTIRAKPSGQFTSEIQDAEIGTQQGNGRAGFPITFFNTAPNASPDFERFCRLGELLRNDRDKCRIALSFCRDVPILERRSEYLHYILKDVDDLDFAQSRLDFGAEKDCHVFEEICDFLSNHPVGKKLSFEGYINHWENEQRSKRLQAAVLRLLTNNTSLTAIRFSNCKFINDSIDDIAKKIGESACIEEVAFDSCYIAETQSVIRMADEFAKNAKLKSVSLCNNTINWKGASYLIAMDKWSTLHLKENLVFEVYYPKVLALIKTTQNLIEFSIEDHYSKMPIEILEQLAKNKKAKEEKEVCYPNWKLFNSLKQPNASDLPPEVINLVLGMRIELLTLGTQGK